MGPLTRDTVRFPDPPERRLVVGAGGRSRRVWIDRWGCWHGSLSQALAHVAREAREEARHA